MRRWAAVLAAVLVASSVGTVASEPGGVRAVGAQERDPGVVRVDDKNELPDVPPLESERLPNAGALSPHTVETSSDDPPTAVDRAITRASESGEAVEVPSLRTETRTTYANPDGTLTDELATGPVRVRTADGGWTPVDPALVVDEGGVRPKAVPNDVTLSAGGGDGPLVSVRQPGDEAARRNPDPGPETRAAAADKSVSIGASGELPAPRIEGTTATYPGAAAGGSDLVVESSTVGAEVSVVIPDRDAAREVYEFPLGLEGLRAEQDESGGIVLADSAGATVGYSPAPIMFDASGEPLPGIHERYGPVGSELVDRDGGQVLVVRPDVGFLNDPETTFPVTIDPATDLYAQRDTFVYETGPNQASDSAQTIYAGTTTLTGRMRAFAKFDTSSFEGTNINAASVKAYQHIAGSCTPTPLDVVETTPLGPGATWNNQPSTIGGVRGSVNTTGDDTNCPNDVGYKTVPVRDLVQEWADDAATTGSVSLRASETDDAHYKGFYARSTLAPPTLRVNYLSDPDDPSDLRPADNATLDTLRPPLTATFDNPDGVSMDAVFRLYDDNNAQLDSHTVIANPGEAKSWTVPDETLRAGQAYSWSAQACVGIFPVFCSAEVTRGFTVNPGLAAGDRPYFTYTNESVSDRSTVKVNVASGNLVVNNNDLTVSGTGMPLEVRRTYNSLSSVDAMVGQRWSQTYTDTVRLEANPDGSFTFSGGSGEVSLITKNPGGDYSTPGDLDATFVDAQGYGVYVLRFNHDRGQRRQGESLYFYNGKGPFDPGLENKLWGSTERNGHSRTLTYAPNLQPSEIVDSQDRPFGYTFDGNGHLTKIDDPNGNRSVDYAYDGQGDLDTVGDLAGNVTDYDYDADHNLTQITDPNGGVIRVEYDGDSRVTKLTRENDGVDESTTFSYQDPSSPGQVGITNVTDARQNTTDYRWDFAHRVTETTNALGDDVENTYDINSNVTMIEDGGGNQTQLGWDSDNNQTSSEMATGARSEANYASGGSGLAPYQPTDSTDPQTNQTTYGYTSDDLTSIVNALPSQNTTSVTRQGDGSTDCGAQEGQVCTSTDARGKATDYDYDSVGNLTQITPPSPLGSTSYTYDAVSRVKTVTDGKAQTRTYTYDNLDRVTRVFYPGAQFAYAYDANGNTTGRIDPQGWWAFGYDDANRLLSQNGAQSYAYTYDKVGNPITLTDPGGTTSYEYTAINELAKVTDPDGAETTFAYEPNHGTWRTDVGYPNGVTVDINHDDSGRVARITSRNASQQIMNDDQYSFEDSGGSTAGNGDTALRQDWTDTQDKTVNYAYDQANRLVEADTRNPNNNPVPPQYDYTYDGVGNRTSATVDGTTTTYSYNNADQINGATHDANGNMTSSNDGLTSASYNTLDQTTSLTPNGGTALTQEHAGTTQTQWLTSGNTDFHTSGSTGITVIDDAGTQSSYTREPDGSLISMKRGGDTYYYIYDGRGSIVGLTDPAGDQVNYYRYSPYGQPEINFEGVENHWKFNAGYTIDDTTYKYGARYYDTTIGRWTQVDPAGLEANHYSYAQDDPVNRSDPTGLSTCGDGGLGGVVDCLANPTDIGAEEAIGLAGRAGGCIVGYQVGSLTGFFAGGLVGGPPGLVAGKAIGGAAGCAAGFAATPNAFGY